MTISPEIVELEPQNAIAVRGEVPIPELPRFFEHAFTTAAAAVEANQAEIVGPPFGFYPSMPAERVTVEAGFPVSAAIEPDGEAHSLVLPGGRAVVVIHTGPFETLQATYADLQEWMEEQDLRPAAGMWESYLTDPVAEPDQNRWQTEIVWPIV